MNIQKYAKYRSHYWNQRVLIRRSMLNSVKHIKTFIWNQSQLAGLVSNQPIEIIMNL